MPGLKPLGWCIFRAPHPRGAQCPRVVLVLGAAGEYIHLALPMARDLNDQMSRSAKAVKPEPLAPAKARHFERAVSDHTGAEKGGGLEIREALG